jgi:rare lipoprotein A
MNLKIMALIIVSSLFTSNEALAKSKINKIGMASWYGSESGSRTASGKRFHPNGLTAAHRTLAFGTKVKVTNLDNKKTIVVTINDRGPFVRGRIIDLSKGAARSIGVKGVQKVSLNVIHTPPKIHSRRS